MTDTPNLDNDLLAAWVHRHDRDALAQLFGRLTRPALAVARRLAGDHAEDAVQEGFLAAMRGAKPQRIDDARGWVLAVVANAARQLRRAQERRERHHAQIDVPPSAAPTPEPDDDLVHQVMRAMQRLLPTEREALELRIIDGLSSNETAQVLGRRPGTIDVQVHRAREKLRTWLGASATPAALMVAVHACASAVEPSTDLCQRVGEIAAQGPMPTSAPMWPWYAVGGTAIAASIAVAVTVQQPDTLPPAPTAIIAPPVVVADPPRAADAPWGGRAGTLLKWVAADHQIAAGIDADWLKRNAGALKPSSLFVDPRVAPALTEIRRQLALYAATSPWPDYAAAWDAAGGMVMTMDFDRARKQEVGLQVIDLGERATDVHERFRARFADTVAERQDGTHWMTATDAALLTPAVQPARNLPLDAPLWIHWRDTNWLPQHAALDRDRSDPVGLGTWFGPNWRSAKPEATIRLHPDDGAWRATTTFTGIELPFHALSAAVTGPLSGTAPCGRWAHLAIGMQPASLALIASGTLQTLPPGLSGDVLVTVDEGAPLPVFGLVLGLQSVAGQREAVSGLLARFGATAPSERAEGTAWQIAAPFGIVTVILGRDRLVATTALDPAPWFVNGSPDARVARGLIDPAAVKPWLPLLWSQIPQKATPFWDTYLEDAMNVLYSGLLNQYVPKAKAGEKYPILETYRTLAQRGIARFGSDLAQYHSAQGGPRTNPKDPEGRAACATLLLQRLSDGRFDFTRHVAVYGRPAFMGKEQGDMIQAERGFIRIAREQWLEIRPFGLSVVGPDVARAPKSSFSNESMTVLSSTEVTVASTDSPSKTALLLMSETKAEDLEILTISEQPEFRWRAWIPPLVAVADHLPAWRFEMRQDEQGVTAIEHGLPLSLISARFFLVSFDRRVSDIYYRSLDTRDEKIVRARHADKVAALERVRQACVAYHQEHNERLVQGGMRPVRTPPLSAVLARGGCEARVLAPFFGGRIPATTDIDSLGRYVPWDWAWETSKGPFYHIGVHGLYDAPILTVALEPGWVALIHGRGMTRDQIVVTSFLLPTVHQADDPRPGPDLEKVVPQRQPRRQKVVQPEPTQQAPTPPPVDF